MGQLSPDLPKHLSIHLCVDDLVSAISFYTEMFGCVPTHSDAERAEWQDDGLMLDFGISRRQGGELALIRLGLPLDSAAAFADLATRLPPIEAAEPALADPDPALGDVRWLLDPAGVLWEAFHQPEARRLAPPSRAEFMAARLAREEDERRHAFVFRRRLLRRRAGYSGRSEARM